MQALAGQRFATGNDLALTEARLKAFIAFSPSLGKSPLGGAQSFGAVARPMLCVTGSLDQDPLGVERTGEHRLAVYEGLPAGRRALLWLDGADHMTFAGNVEQRIGARRGLFKRAADVAWQEDEDHAIVARVTSAWWQAQLLGDGAALRTLPALRPNDRWRMD